jgi:3-hydroxyacyl-[acyl-carrier-protein] dehydratase
MPMLSFHIPVDHPAFAGHFPGRPITPGVVLLDWTVHAIAEQLNLDMQTCKIGNTKFLRPVLPDTQLTVHYDVSAQGNIRFDIKDNHHVAATGVFHA